VSWPRHSSGPRSRSSRARSTNGSRASSATRFRSRRRPSCLRSIAALDPTARAQILVGYVGAGFPTPNEARARLGLAPAQGAAANALASSTKPSLSFDKAYDPREPRDAWGRWTTGSNGAPAASEDRAKAGRVQVAGDDAGAAMFLDFLGGAASVAAAIAAWRRANEAARRPEGVAGPSPATHHPSKPAEDKETAPPPPAVPQTSAAAPAPPPEDPRQDRESRQADPKGGTPKKPSYEIGASDGGPGKWAKVNEGISSEKAAYQQKATGAPPGTAYDVPDPGAKSGVTSFDGYDPETNTLIDAKRWTGWPIEEDFSNRRVVETAKRQIRAAKGTKIVWRVASREKVSVLRDIFDDRNISGISVEFLEP